MPPAEPALGPQLGAAARKGRPLTSVTPWEPLLGARRGAGERRDLSVGAQVLRRAARGVIDTADQEKRTDLQCWAGVSVLELRHAGGRCRRTEAHQCILHFLKRHRPRCSNCGI